MLYRGLARRGRAYLLWGAAGFVAVQFGLGLLIDLAWTDVRDPEYAGKLWALKELRAEEPGTPLVVALGSSRTQLGLRAADLHPTVDGKPALVYNFAIPGSGPMGQLLNLRRLLAEKVRPDRVVVEIMPAFYNERQGRLLDERNLDGARLKASELAWTFRYAKEPRMLAWTWAIGRGLPCYRHGVELARKLPVEGGAPQGKDFAHGWAVQHAEVTPEERQRYTEQAMGQYEGAFINYRLAPQAVRALHDLLGLCRSKGIGFVMVAPPEGAPFRALCDPAAAATIDAFLADLRREWGVPVIDARTWVADEDFWDTHHLLPSGAKVFTDRLAPELEAAWGAPQAPASVARP